MKKFHFRLEPLLILKKRKEDNEIRNFSIVVSAINLLTEEKDSLVKEIDQVGSDISKRIQTGTSFKDYTDYSDISRFLSLKIKTIEDSIEKKQPELDLARIRLNEASKERKVMELLKDKDWKEHKKKLQKEEKKELEEFILVHEFYQGNQKEQPPSTLKILSDELIEDSEELVREEKPLTELEKLEKMYKQHTK
jgi:flagellar FliJ protein